MTSLRPPQTKLFSFKTVSRFLEQYSPSLSEIKAIIVALFLSAGDINTAADSVNNLVKNKQCMKQYHLKLVNQTTSNICSNIIISTNIKGNMKERQKKCMLILDKIIDSY